MENLGGPKNSMLPRDLRGGRPQGFGKRQAPTVATPPPLEASVNPLHAIRNFGRCLGRNRRSSVPCRDYDRRYQLRPGSFMQAYRKLTAPLAGIVRPTPSRESQRGSLAPFSSISAK